MFKIILIIKDEFHNIRITKKEIVPQSQHRILLTFNMTICQTFKSIKILLQLITYVDKLTFLHQFLNETCPQFSHKV